ncbi:LysR substrate-binding domain-containing protein [Pseudomonas lundensis]|uniref:LysR substrate-binding domain-containing protein n=1 Tax=Pseudomonas lundensis TaxID=86185 RepID=UPI0040467FC0
MSRTLPLVPRTNKGVPSQSSSVRTSCPTSAPFIPSKSQQVFTFAASDVTALAVLPGLVARLEAQAPHLQLRVHSTLYRDSMDDLASGRAQFVLGFSDEYSGPYEGVEVLEGATEDYVVVGCSAHAGPDSALSLEHYLSARHVVVMPWTDAGSVIDVALAQQSLKRNVALQVHSMAVAPLLVAGSKLLLTIPRPVAAQLCRDERFVTYEMPFSSPRYTIKVLFHARFASSPGHRWIREQIRVLLSGLDGF